jgi:hypothetical protein
MYVIIIIVIIIRWLILYLATESDMKLLPWQQHTTAV